MGVKKHKLEIHISQHFWMGIPHMRDGYKTTIFYKNKFFTFKDDDELSKTQDKLYNYQSQESIKKDELSVCFDRIPENEEKELRHRLRHFL